MVPSHRRALRARLLSFRYIDGPLLRNSFSSQGPGVVGAKQWPGGPRPTMRRQSKPYPTGADCHSDGSGANTGFARFMVFQTGAG
jgi:hypothetical protein